MCQEAAACCANQILTAYRIRTSYGTSHYLHQKLLQLYTITIHYRSLQYYSIHQHTRTPDILMETYSILQLASTIFNIQHTASCYMLLPNTQCSITYHSVVYCAAAAGRSDTSPIHDRSRRKCAKDMEGRQNSDVFQHRPCSIARHPESTRGNHTWSASRS